MISKEKKLKTVLGLGEHCPSLRSVTTPDPTQGEVKTVMRSQKRFVLQKGFQYKSALYWTDLEIVFWWKSVYHNFVSSCMKMFLIGCRCYLI